MLALIQFSCNTFYHILPQNERMNAKLELGNSLCAINDFPVWWMSSPPPLPALVVNQLKAVSRALPELYVNAIQCQYILRLMVCKPALTLCSPFERFNYFTFCIYSVLFCRLHSLSDLYWIRQHSQHI